MAFGNVSTCALYLVVACVFGLACSGPAVTQSADRVVLQHVVDKRGAVITNDCSVHGSYYSGRCGKLHAHWNPSALEAEQLRFVNIGRPVDTVYTRILHVAKTQLKDYFFLESTIPQYDCPPCKTSIGVVEVRRHDSKQKNLNWQIHVISSGNMGESQGPKEIDMGKGMIGFIFEWNNIGQGLVEGGIQLLADNGNGIHEILNLQTENSNEGDCGTPDKPCWKTISVWQMATTGNNEYFDIQVKITGTELQNDSIEEISKDLIYKYDNGKYVPY
jgi:hypothetical protein